jgi:hypothetical protein
MLKQKLLVIVIAGNIGLFTGVSFASEHAYPRTHAIQSMEGAHIIGEHLMTPDEKKIHQQKMQHAKTPKEREQILRLNHQKMEARAKERGVPLRKMPPGQEEYMEHDSQHRNTMSNEMGDTHMSPKNHHHD